MRRAVWVTRDDGDNSSYNLYKTKPSPRDRGFSCWPFGIDLFCPELFERITGFRLKPGEGPVRVRIKVERVK